MQIHPFTGTIPEYYDEYLGPLIFEEYSADLARRVSVPPDGDLLETAAGTGLATRHLRACMPEHARMVVTDLSESMLDVARSKFDPSPAIEFQPADASRLPFDAARFDAVVCQFGWMFFPDKGAAIREAARVLRPGGTLLFSVWDSFEHNLLIRSINETLVSLHPGEPLSFFETPYGWHCIDEIRALLLDNGFEDIEISVLSRASRAETARRAALAFIMGTPVCRQVAKLGRYPLEVVVDITEKHILETFGSAPICAKMQAIIFKSTRICADLSTPSQSFCH